MECIFDLFTRLTNITEAHIYLPESLLLADGQNMEVQDSARTAEEIMMGIYVIERTWKEEIDAETLELFYDHDEEILEHDTAVYARNKLDVMTNYGLLKISEAEYYDFITIWPYLDRLSRYDRGGEFKGMWHYTKGRKTENLPLQVLEELPYYGC
jgi:hypothetical protein